MEENMRAETPKKRVLAKRAGIALIWFFAAMLALTYLSRAVGESLKAEISVGYAGTSSLDESVEGTGEWAVGPTQLYTTYYTRRITQVFVRPGQAVAAGDPLFAYDVSTIKGGKDVSDKKVRSAKRALNKAEAALEDAEDPAYAQSVVENAAQALSYAEFTYAQTYALQNGGVVRSSFSGTVVKCDLSVGKASAAGSTGFQIAPDGVSFTMTVTGKEAERIEIGRPVILYDDGKEEKEPLTVSAMEPPDAEGNVTVTCAGSGGKERLVGTMQDWKIKKQSQQHQLTIPLAALRQGGGDQYYVLVLAEKETILGMQLVAQKREVTLIARDSLRAAVNGGISERDRLITTSSKELRDGDLVVLKDA